MPKCKPKKALLKRIRITKSGQIKFHRAFGRHLRSGKGGKLLRSYRRPAYAHSSDIKRIERMLFMSIRASNRRDRSCSSCSCACED